MRAWLRSIEDNFVLLLDVVTMPAKRLVAGTLGQREDKRAAPSGQRGDARAAAFGVPMDALEREKL